MTGPVLLSTAYFPPVEYFARIAEEENILIEREENYRKQSYRNRCYILSSNGIQMLTVPVLSGSFHKTPVKDIKIDYSKRWQQVHIGALKAAYSSSPYYLFYSETFENIILYSHAFLFDLNMELLIAVLEILRIKAELSYTTYFKSVSNKKNDLRYSISPKIVSHYQTNNYIQVFNPSGEFVPGLSILDLLFNEGPDSQAYL